MQEQERHDIDFGLQLKLARRADELGFSAIWVRDVPLNSPAYPDSVGHSDPWVLLGALAASTRSIALATGAIVLPLRHPLHVAKAALSMDALSSGRFILGLGSGDRPSEFAAGAWMTYHRPLGAQKDRIALWHGAVQRTTTEFRGMGQAMALDLLDTPSDHIDEINLGYRTGPEGLLAALSSLRNLGTHHVAFNLLVNGCKALTDLEIIAREILPRLNQTAELQASR
jgi:alkanesulfonate monooxygenase SsuD/methylene tetrahydromethanopterin reductase-like flavin-dependent oxidoreductase (luciferase family)